MLICNLLSVNISQKVWGTYIYVGATVKDYVSMYKICKNMYS